MNTPAEPYQALVKLSQLPEIKENARECNEILGVIAAISAAPETVELSEWFPSLWAKGIPSFSNEKLASDFAQACLVFYEHCLANYSQSIPLSLPLEAWLDEYQQLTEQGVAFASGYLSGFQSTEKIWQALDLPEGSQPEQLLQTTTLLLSKMAAVNSSEPQMQALFAQLPEMEEIISSLPALLCALGNFSTQINNDE